MPVILVANNLSEMSIAGNPKEQNCQYWTICATGIIPIKCISCFGVIYEEKKKERIEVSVLDVLHNSGAEKQEKCYRIGKILTTKCQILSKEKMY